MNSVNTSLLRTRLWVALSVALPALFLVSWARQTSPPTAPATPLASSTNPASPAPSAAGVWYFAVSGDSRNCGNVVMPKIARSIADDNSTTPAEFFWHLGDFRNGLHHPDHDYRPRNGDKRPYQAQAWDDFLTHQVSPFDGITTVFLGIGNHELLVHASRNQFRRKFERYMPPRSSDDDHNGIHAARERVDYHFERKGVEFIYMDNAFGPIGAPEFEEEQLRWLKAVLLNDLKNPGIRAVVVGMHAALPGSVVSNHAMDTSCEGRLTGGQAYGLLADVRNKGKKVYVFASHSHSYSPNIYKTDSHPIDPLDGWVIGTAGAPQYDREIRYGYLLCAMASDGSLTTVEKWVTPNSPPEPTDADRDLCNWCYTMNRESKPHDSLQRSPCPAVGRSARP